MLFYSILSPLTREKFVFKIALRKFLLHFTSKDGAKWGKVLIVSLSVRIALSWRIPFHLANFSSSHPVGGVQI